jgi:hypothetical protein
MKQVFIGTSAQAVATTSEANNFTDLAAEEIGLWDLNAGGGAGGFFTTQLFESQVEEGVFEDTGTDTATGDLVTIGHPVFLKSRIQIAQGYGSGNPIASPIIDTSKITRIKVDEAAGETRHKVRVTPNASDDGDNCTLKIVIRTAPTAYLDFVNGQAALADLSGSNYPFPLGVFNTTNHKVLNIGSTGADAEAHCDALVANIAANETLNALFTTTDNASSVDLEARHAHVIFDLIWVNDTDGSTSGSTAIQAEWHPGVGNDWQVRAEEMKARAQFGNFNRMYFPDTVTDFVTAGEAFDRVEVTYKIDGDRAVVKGSQFGTAVIYEKTTGTTIQSVFNNGAAASGSSEYLF